MYRHIELRNFWPWINRRILENWIGTKKLTFYVWWLLWVIDFCREEDLGEYIELRLKDLPFCENGRKSLGWKLVLPFQTCERFHVLISFRPFNWLFFSIPLSTKAILCKLNRRNFKCNNLLIKPQINSDIQRWEEKISNH